MLTKTNINKNGFTLAEVMIVVSILAILSAATLPIISKRENRSASLLSGSIVMWSGTQIPRGYAICDGGNGTPDLRNRFVIAANNNSANTYYYQNSDTTFPPQITSGHLPQHNHAFSSTSNDGNHSHSFNTANDTFVHEHDFGFSSTGAHNHTIYAWRFLSTGSYAFLYDRSKGGSSTVYYTSGTRTSDSANRTHGHAGTSNYDGGHTHTVTLESDSPASHTHSGTVANQGASGTISLTGFPYPPYYALYYIMKL